MFKKSIKKCTCMCVAAVAMLLTGAFASGMFGDSVAEASMRTEVLSSKTSLPDAGEFNIIAEPFDWGKDVTRIMINPNSSVSKGDLSADDFTVNAVHYSKQAYKDDYNGPRKVLAAYPVDDKGNKVDDGDYIILELEYGSNVKAGHTGSYDYANFYTPLTLTYDVQWTKSAEKFKQHDVVSLLCDEFEVAKYTDTAVSSDSNLNSINYAYYEPEKDEVKNPLIVFFHGNGEGGGASLDNHGVQMYAYPECNLADTEIQTIMGNAYVLLPQANERWSTGGIDQETGMIDIVNSLIDSIADNPDIDKNRIYVGGLSMGGYMTCQAILSRPDYYAAAFPCCQAYAMKDSDAAKLVNLPIWISCSEADQACTMDPYTFTSFQKLLAAGIKECKCAVMEKNNTDPTSRFRFYDNTADDFKLYYCSQENENKIKGDFVWDNVSYAGHNGGWIPVFNNGTYYMDQDDMKITIMDWVASQTKVTNLTIDASKAKTEFKRGEAFNADGLVVTAQFRDGSSAVVTDYTIKNVDMTKGNTVTVLVTYSGFTASYDITIKDNAVIPLGPTPSPVVTKPLATASPAPALVISQPPVLTLNKKDATLLKKGVNTLDLEVKCNASADELNKLVWSSSNDKVATVKGNLAKAKVTAKSAGTAIITVTLNGVSSSCKVTVVNAKFKLAKNKMTIKRGKSAKIKLTLSPKKKVTYTSANGKIAKVNKKGVIKGIKKGKTKITIKAFGVSQVITITVK